MKYQKSLYAAVSLFFVVSLAAMESDLQEENLLESQFKQISAKLITNKIIIGKGDDSDREALTRAVFGNRLTQAAFLSKKDSDIIEQGAAPLVTIESNSEEPSITSSEKSAGCPENLLVDVFEPIMRRSSIDALNEHGDTALHYLASGKVKELISLLLHMGMSINQPNEEGETPLHQALMFETDAFVMLLINKGANVEVSDKNKNSALHYAVQWEREGIIPVLLARGPECLNQRNVVGKTPLRAAFEKKNHGIAKQLIESGADVQDVDENGNTLIHYVVDNKFCQVIPLLVKAGVSINQQNKEGKTPLHRALLGKAFEDIETTIATLLEHGASVSVADYNGNTVLHDAISCKFPAAIAMLINKATAIDQRNDNGETALQRAVKFNNSEVIRMLIEVGVGCSVNAADKNGDAPLLNAVNRGYFDIARQLIEAGADRSILSPELREALACPEDVF